MFDALSSFGFKMFFFSYGLGQIIFWGVVLIIAAFVGLGLVIWGISYLLKQLAPFFKWLNDIHKRWSKFSIIPRVLVDIVAVIGFFSTIAIIGVAAQSLESYFHTSKTDTDVVANSQWQVIPEFPSQSREAMLTNEAKPRYKPPTAYLAASTEEDFLKSCTADGRTAAQCQCFLLRLNADRSENIYGNIREQYLTSALPFAAIRSLAECTSWR